jgi:hypothetical protein
MCTVYGFDEKSWKTDTVREMSKKVFRCRQKSRFPGNASVANEDTVAIPEETAYRIQHFFGPESATAFNKRQLPGLERQPVTSATNRPTPDEKKRPEQENASPPPAEQLQPSLKELAPNHILVLFPEVKYFLFNLWYNNTRLHQTHANAEKLSLRLYPMTLNALTKASKNIVYDQSEIYVQTGMIFRQLQVVENTASVANRHELHEVSYLHHM